MNDKNNEQESMNHEKQTQPIVGLPHDERDVLISRVIDGNASPEDWSTFRSLAAHEPEIWSELAQTQNVHESLTDQVGYAIAIADGVELPGGFIDDQPMRARLEWVSRWGGWAAAAAILLVWFFGNPMNKGQFNDLQDETSVAGLPGQGFVNKPYLDQAQPEQAFDQYISSGMSNGQVIGEMPEHIVIETRPMPDGTIEVLYLRQIIERQIIDHAYREVLDEQGNMVPVPIELSPTRSQSF
jgi:hypothetical protein